MAEEMADLPADVMMCDHGWSVLEYLNLCRVDEEITVKDIKDYVLEEDESFKPEEEIFRRVEKALEALANAGIIEWKKLPHDGADPTTCVLKKSISLNWVK